MPLDEMSFQAEKIRRGLQELINELDEFTTIPVDEEHYEERRIKGLLIAMKLYIGNHDQKEFFTLIKNEFGLGDKEEEKSE